MKRRLLLRASTQLVTGSATLLMLACAHAQPSYKVSGAQLQQALAKRFPRRYPVGGLLELEAQVPRLRFMTEQNRLGVELPMLAAGPVLRRNYNGIFDLDFALRFEASDLSIRAHQLRVNSLQFEGLPPQTSVLLAAYGPALAEQALQGAVLHQLRPQDLALPDSMGLQPGSITVTEQGLVIGFVTKHMP
ncbi:MAG: DUF1439 domain-containing protein [Polaromonas sp.]|nr:DUF1439 domain-containing protein [Polaromonas sp.]